MNIRCAKHNSQANSQIVRHCSCQVSQGFNMSHVENNPYHEGIDYRLVKHNSQQAGEDNN